MFTSCGTEECPGMKRADLTWKNALKCRAILDARGVNASDPRKPPKFRLLGLEAIRHWMGRARPRRVGGGRCRVFLAKLDLQNAYWSIRLPTAWRSVFVVGGPSGRRFRYARLPFGWAYSPVICQKLVSSVIRGPLSRRGVRGWVYLNDILLLTRSRGGPATGRCGGHTQVSRQAKHYAHKGINALSCDKAFQNPCHSAKRERKYVQQHIRICTHGVKTGLG